MMRLIPLLLSALACHPSLAESDVEFESATTVTETDRNLRSLPTDDIWWTVNGERMGWYFRNVHKLFPTVTVYRDGAVSDLVAEPMDEIATFPVTTPGGDIGFADWLDSEHTTAMGVVILHQGKIVFERYPRMQDYEKPVYWSVAKILVSTVVRLLEERGQIDVSRPIEDYIPSIAGSGFAGTTVRNLLDMASGLDCPDSYETWDSCYYRYSMAIGDGFRTDDAPDNPYDYIREAAPTRVAEQGHQFSYSGANTFILAWLVEEVTGMPFQDALTSEIWRHIGAESDASYFAPRYGIPVTHGGFLARMRDVARFGLLFTPSRAVVSDRQIISDEHVELLLHGGNPDLFGNLGFGPPEKTGVRHNVYQWDQVYTNDTIFKGGWAGQGLAINPEWDVVAVFTSYFKDDEQSEMKLEPVVLELLNGVFGDGP